MRVWERYILRENATGARAEDPESAMSRQPHVKAQLYGLDVRGDVCVRMIYFDREKSWGKGFFLKGARMKRCMRAEGGQRQVNSLSRTCFGRSLNGQCPAAELTKGDPRGSRDPPTIRMWSDGTRERTRRCREKERERERERERRPVPHSESVRTRFHISHNRLVAKRSFLAISPGPFWYPTWSLISPVCSGQIKLIFWRCSTFRDERRFWKFARFIQHKEGFPRMDRQV